MAVAVIATTPIVGAEATGNVCREDSRYAGQRDQYRFTGADRYETAICASYWNWQPHNAPWRADAVVLARGDLFADALAGGPLAGHVNGPLLLNPPNALLPSVKAEIQRLLAPGDPVYLLGSTGALSDAVASALQSMGYVTRRIAGADRYETAVRVAQEMPPTDRFFLTTGTDFPDALAAGAYATYRTHEAARDVDPATTPLPLLFTDNAVMPTSTRNHIVASGDNPVLYSAGGAATTATTRAFGPGVTSFVGPDRYATATLIAERLYTGPDGKLTGFGVGLASGTDFPDGLTATTALMDNAQPLLLTPPTTLAPTTRDFLHRHAGDIRQESSGELDGNLEVFGGLGAISAAVVTAAKTAYTA
ncbi:cell wall-binding repeat-containing protein [Actinokineospora soli]|uniref:Cell wall-binding repeat-containing protein n=1 Tax=Actinokineospora soli TaxID=1048753 RepID=A0ABW2TT39_9PSEU